MTTQQQLTLDAPPTLHDAAASQRDSNGSLIVPGVRRSGKLESGRTVYRFDLLQGSHENSS